MKVAYTPRNESIPIYYRVKVPNMRKLLFPNAPQDRVRDRIIVVSREDYKVYNWAARDRSAGEDIEHTMDGCNE